MNIITQSKQTFEEYISDFTKNVKLNGLKQLQEELERIDLLLTYKRPKSFRIVNIRSRQILTTIGLLTFKRRYYLNEKTREYLYLLDAVLGIPKRDKLDNNLKIKLINAASEMSYRKAGIYASDEQYPVSKSTICRLIRSSDFYVDDNLSLSSKDNHKIHVQIDEKFIHSINNRSKKKHYTCSIFKGVKTVGKRRILLNRYLISSNSLSTIFKRVNHILVKKYLVTLDDQIYLSGDLATYIQNAPERITVCNSLYVPDKYHIKAALKKSLGLIVTDEELNDISLQKQLLAVFSNSCDSDDKKIYNLLHSNPTCFNAYLDSQYLGCSQEAMNSHYYCSRFDKVPNTFSSKAIEHLSTIINARENKQIIHVGFNVQYYDSPILFDIDLSSYPHRKYIDKSNMKSQTRKLFIDIESGRY